MGSFEMGVAMGRRAQTGLATRVGWHRQGPVAPCLLVLGLLATGCGPGLVLRGIESAHRKPANVAVYFSVSEPDGEPVADLLASDFRIYEDGSLVSIDESRQTIVNPELAATHHTLLLVDMSASVTASEQVGEIVKAAQAFVARVEAYQKVAVYAFDGSKQIHPITPFTGSEARTNEGITSLESFQTKDPSTNLHGAVVQALQTLDQAIKHSSTPLNFGTLVVFTDGTDRAARVSLQDMQDALQASDHTVFAIGVGNEIDDSTLSRVGRDGYIRVEDRAAAASAFDQISMRIIGITRRYYLLSYCSPARAGKHVVTVEAVHEQGTGELSYEFDATGFGADCDPNRPPPFDTSGRTSRARKRLAEAEVPED